MEFLLTKQSRLDGKLKFQEKMCKIIDFHHFLPFLFFFCNFFNISLKFSNSSFKNSIDETDWSMAMAEEIYNNEFECQGCGEKFNFTNLQKLQHVAVCKKPEDIKVENIDDSRPSSSSKNLKLFNCTICLKEMRLTNIEILKHKKNCKIKKEIE